jgi:hypothetical protein
VVVRDRLATQVKHLGDIREEQRDKNTDAQFERPPRPGCARPRHYCGASVGSLPQWRRGAVSCSTCLRLIYINEWEQEENATASGTV